jgi:hypothetical protein
MGLSLAAEGKKKSEAMPSFMQLHAGQPLGAAQGWCWKLHY